MPILHSRTSTPKKTAEPVNITLRPGPHTCDIVSSLHVISEACDVIKDEIRKLIIRTQHNEKKDNVCKNTDNDSEDEETMLPCGQRQ